MNEKTYEKLTQWHERYQQLEKQLSNSQLAGQERKELASELRQLHPIIGDFVEWKKLSSALEELKPLLEAEDLEMRSLAQEEHEQLLRQSNERLNRLKIQLLPKDPDVDRPCYVEIRAGTGGEEASLFCAELYRMYYNYALSKGWEVSLQDRSDSETGGIKEIYFKVTGKGAYGRLKHETGGHRVQRVPQTESQGRIHTSACVVLVIPEPNPAEAPLLKASDLRIDTYRASGAGGQHVNKTDSAVRITHLPTGLVVTCQDGRSQLQNREAAMQRLEARLKALEKEKRDKENKEFRMSLLSSGSRTDRIRTYNFPQSRITDHRVPVTLHQLESILEGRLDLLLDPILEAYQAQRLESSE